MADHADLAKALFLEGYNCSQAVFCAYCDQTGMDRETAARIASSFGGGLARMREVCGTVSGAALVLGTLLGYSDPKDLDAKARHYRLVQEFARRFEAQAGSILCRDLLANIPTTPGGDPEPRSAEYYQRRPCPRLAWLAAQIVDEMLAEAEG